MINTTIIVIIIITNIIVITIMNIITIIVVITIIIRKSFDFIEDYEISIIYIT